MSNDPGYVRRFYGAYTPSGQIVEPPPRIPAAEWAGYSTSTAALLSKDAGGYVAFDEGTATTNLIFPPVRVSATTYQITTTLKLSYKSADATRYIMARFALQKDRDGALFTSADSHGYALVLLNNGTAKIERYAGAAIVTLVTGTWAALNEGDTLPLQIDVTPTSITVTRTDTSETLSTSDTTHARPGFFDVAANGNRVGLGTTTVTY
jgi:hypothetical protein